MVWNIIKVILMIIGAVLTIWFALPFFSNRILNIGNITGLIVGFVILLYGIFFHTANFYIAHIWHFGVGKAVEIIIGLAILAIFVLALLTMISMSKGMKPYTANYEASENKDADSTNTDTAVGDQVDRDIIILGCKIRDDKPSLMLIERLDAGLRYFEAHPGSLVIVSGGQGEDEIAAEADVMHDWLVANGISEDRIIKEDRSTDTEENLAFSRKLLQEINAEDDPVLIVTNEFHEYRALKKAAKLGIKAEALPAKTAWWLFPTYYVREMYGILEDWFL